MVRFVAPSGGDGGGDEGDGGGWHGGDGDGGGIIGTGGDGNGLGGGGSGLVTPHFQVHMATLS